MDAKVLKVIRFSVFQLREGIWDFCIDLKIKQIKRILHKCSCFIEFIKRIGEKR